MFLCILLVDFPVISWRERGAGDTDCQRLAHMAHNGFCPLGWVRTLPEAEKSDTGDPRLDMTLPGNSPYQQLRVRALCCIGHFKL